jgi:hypothetical protein
MKYEFLVLMSDRLMRAIPEFMERLKRYWPDHPRLGLCGFTEPSDLPEGVDFICLGKYEDFPFQKWSNAFLKMLDHAQPNFLFMLEDYYLTDYVDGEYLQELKAIAASHHDLFKLDVYGDRENHGNCVDLPEHQGLLESLPNSDYQMSFMAGYWNRDMLRGFIPINMNPWEIELQLSHKVPQEFRVFGTKSHHPIKYQVAYRAGRRVLKDYPYYRNPKAEGKREHILLCPTSTDRRVTADIALFMAQAATLSGNPDYPFRYSFTAVTGMRGYAITRNQAVKRFLSTDCDRLWFFDDDILPVHALLDLPFIDADIVGAQYPWIGNFRPGMCNFVNDKNYKDGHQQPDFDAETNPAPEVMGIGMGATIIRRRVLEDPQMRYEAEYETRDGQKHELSDKDAPPIFRLLLRPNGEIHLGEDFDFCIRARRLGYTVRTHYGIKCGHLKSIDLNAAWDIVTSQLTVEPVEAVAV